MSKKLEALLRKIFYASLGGLVTNSAVAYDAKTEDAAIDDGKFSIEEKSYSLKPKLVLRLVGGSEWKFANHRSHRSHSSHQSHRSHYSSRTNSSYPQSSGGTNNSQASPAPQSLYPSSPTIYQLGSRILRKGMKGTDVTELINILLQKQYLRVGDDSETIPVLTGQYTFDEIVEDAVKRFQKDNSLVATGEVDPTTVFFLKNK